MQERLFKNPKIRVLWDTALEEVVGENEPKGVTGVKLKSLKTGEVAEHHADNVFIAIGHSPATELFKGQLPMKAGGYLITKPNSTATDIPGVFAAGDVTDDVFRQAVTAAGMGCMAALEAQRWLEAQEHALQAAE
jgi:thioredoxin reductase (NADPH)